MDDEVASQNLVNIRVTDDEGEQDAVLELHLNSEAMQMYAMRWNVITAILSGCWNMMPKAIWLLRNIPGGEFTETMQITYQNGDTVKTSTRIRGGDTNGDGLLDANDDGIMMRS